MLVGCEIPDLNGGFLKGKNLGKPQENDRTYIEHGGL
jgi:hypothetical protein